MREAIVSDAREPRSAQEFADRGLARIGRGELEEALADFAEALRLDPNCSDGHDGRGRVCMERGEYAQAVLEFDRALACDARNMGALTCRLECHHRLGDFAKALKYAEVALEIEGHSALNRANRALILFELGRWSEAVQYYSAAIQLDQTDADYRVRRGKCFLKLGQRSHAEADFAEALRLDPANGKNYEQIGYAYCEAGELDSALAAFEQGIRMAPDCQDNYVGRAVALHDKGEFAESIAACDLALRQGCAPESMMYYRGHSHRELGNFAEALRDFDQALQLSPDLTGLYFQRGLAHFGLGNLESAIEDFSEVIRREPDWESSCYHRGAAYVDRGEYEKALCDLDTLVRRGVESLDVLKLRCRCHFSLKNWQQLFEDADRMIEQWPEFFLAYYYRGHAQFFLGNCECAVEDYTIAIENGAATGLTILFRGRSWHQLGESANALNDYNETIRRDPKDASGYFSRGLLYESLDRLEDAFDDFSETIRIEPKDPRHYHNRSRICDYLGLDDEAAADYEMALKLEAEQAERTGEGPMPENKTLIYPLVQEHFNEAPLEKLTITERYFPFRVSADLQLGLEKLLQGERTIRHFYAVERNGNTVSDVSELWQKDRRSPVMATAPRFQEVDIGEEKPVRCLREGLWLLESGGARYALLFETNNSKGPHFQVVARSDAGGKQATEEIFHHLEEAVRLAACYRGKVLSLEEQEQFSGMYQGIRVLKLAETTREQVILSSKTLDLLDRNVLHFVRQRSRLAAIGLPIKKGLLFYGPPGTGKTHTLHYLLGALKGHTAFVISAEQVGLLADYMTLARLYQPSVVVVEDVDLIARERVALRSGGEETLLNRLLNEMDGLETNAEVIFLLTTNNPESLESALVGRPGRIDQAVEFPLPDADCRRRLVRLYGQRLDVADHVVDVIVKRTDRVSASFIKELMRRAAQVHFERDDSERIEQQDVDQALEELLVAGGSLNRKLLGAGAYEGRMGFGPA